MQETQEMDDDELFSFKGVIECAPPNKDIYKFDSRMKLGSGEKTEY